MIQSRRQIDNTNKNSNQNINVDTKQKKANLYYPEGKLKQCCLQRKRARFTKTVTVRKVLFYNSLGIMAERNHNKMNLFVRWRTIKLSL